MSKLRLAVLFVGPLIILISSFAFTRWAKSDAAEAPAQSNLVVRGQGGGPLRLAAAKKPLNARATSIEQRCAVTAADLQKKLGSACAVIVRPPFVIAGDLTQRKLDVWHKQTIAPAAAALANCYFRRAPDHPITVLLFGSERTYDEYARKVFGDEGISVYGYYKPRERTLVMNIATGGGTLVHELTHALMAFDFPEVPDWFNEGLASLHEQCRFREGNDGPWIEGLENWRLAGLQEAIRRKQLRSLEDLIKSDDFRGRDEGRNYAQARYFCLYLQRKGLLREYFRRFQDGHKSDPKGLHAVAGVLPEQSWEELNSQFNAWVMTLKY